MIYVTGDTHGIIDSYKLYMGQFPLQKELTRDDLLIIAGDFGGVWDGGTNDKKVQDFHNEKNYTTLFVSGNHENFTLLETYPVEEWNGGKVHRISDNILHLINGEIFEINGTSIFVMGGATSLDKKFRVEGETWWPDEEPSEETFARALNNLEQHGNKVDYIISHTCPESVRKQYLEVYPGFVDYESGVEKFLDKIKDTVDYKYWYFGHIHIDKNVPESRARILYNDIVELGDIKKISPRKK